ncbi:hypothetical protein [Microbispora catharanthi]|uniref:hypothetical protein n=1 Tax=Microbispora catharanthi TaxID=1712871 RepID=UPI0013782B55|nr:hypothetical protein [Microbispora catharanthi]
MCRQHRRPSVGQAVEPARRLEKHPDLHTDGDQRGRVDEVNAYLLGGTVPAKGTRCG